MGLDTGIYQNIRQVDPNSIPEAYSTGMKLSQLAIQNDKLKQDQADQMALRSSVANNVGADGKINQAAALSDLRGNPNAMMQLQKHFIETNKSTADAQSAQAEAQKKILDMAMPAFNYLMKLPPDQRSKEYGPVVKSMIEKGYPADHIQTDQNGMPVYDDETFKRAAGAILNSEAYANYNKTVTDTDINQQKAPLERAKIAAETNRDQAQANYTANERTAAIGDKKDKEQGKAYSELINHLETFRGNRAAQQASQDVYSANKTLAMVANKDPNTLTTQDLSLLASEMAKIATGGVPGEHGVQQLMPNNLNTKLAEMQSFLMSKPSDANAAEYIKKNMSYLKEMSGEANKTLANYRNNIVKGYKSRIRPEDYNEVVNTYGLGEKPSENIQSNSMTSSGITQIQEAPKHGTVDGGYVFMGGDPSDPKNWMRAK